MIKSNNVIDKIRIGAVVIGRNEGQRLVTCLQSLIKGLDHIVYVDSGSSDSSLHEAEALGVATISLDMSIPFTAARARNEGAQYLLSHVDALDYIQFIDGDCEMQPQWIESSAQFLDEHADYAVACGRRRERFPEHSIYNQLCDIEWNTPVGDAMACGGDALIRISTFNQVNGYNGVLIAGEEPEMCFRLRRLGWKIRRIDAEMTLHDAAITKVGQWWNRAKRAGYAYISSYDLHGSSTEKFKRKELVSIVFWALLTPILILSLSMCNSTFVLLMLAYPIQIMRVAFKHNDMGLGFKVTLFYALSTVMAKWPQLLGIFKFGVNKISGNLGRLIEYK